GSRTGSGPGGFRDAVTKRYSVAARLVAPRNPALIRVQFDLGLVILLAGHGRPQTNSPPGPTRNRRLVMWHSARRRVSRRSNPRTAPVVKKPARTRLACQALEDRSVPSALPDSLYIGDAGINGTSSDDLVRRIDATTGADRGIFVAANSAGLNGPRGLIFANPGVLLVVNQNVNEDFNGEVLRFNGQTGTPLNKLVPLQDPDAPFAPRGIVMRDNTIFVADVLAADGSPGRIAIYDADSGKFKGELVPSPTVFAEQFNPRGVGFGPDGNLYVSVFNTTNPVA